MGSHGRVIGFGHPRNQASFENAARMGKVGLQDRSRARFKQGAKVPLGIKAFTDSDGNVRFARQVCHDLDILRLHDFFVKEGRIGFQGFDQDARGLGTDGPVEVNADINFIADRAA